MPDQNAVPSVLSPAAIARKRSELSTAFNAAAAITNIQRRNETLAQLCYYWAEFDPRGAVSLASSFGLEENGVLENLAQQWAGVDLNATRAWVDARPPGESKSRLVARISYLIAQNDPEFAANYILDQTSPGEIQTEAAISILHQWSQQDSAAATSWARTFPPGELRERALHEVFPVAGYGN